MKRIAALACCVALASCATPHLSLFNLGKSPAKQAPAPMPTAPVGKNCPASLTADVEKKPAVPTGAFIPAPSDPKQKAGWDIFLAYLGNDFAGWANDGWDRAQQAKDWCSR